MKNKKASKRQTFFRSFAVSFIILFSFLALLLGFLTGLARMQSKITGKEVKIEEIISFATNKLW